MSGDIREVEQRIIDAVLGALDEDRNVPGCEVVADALKKAAPMRAIACRKSLGGCGFRALMFMDREVAAPDRCPACGLPDLGDPEAVLRTTWTTMVPCSTGFYLVRTIPGSGYGGIESPALCLVDVDADGDVSVYVAGHHRERDIRDVLFWDGVDGQPCVEWRGPIMPPAGGA